MGPGRRARLLIAACALLACRAGNAAPGQQIFATCVPCLGARAEGNAAKSAPALAGQHAAYLQRQLQNFRSGVRGTHEADLPGAQMRAAVTALRDDAAVFSVAAYVAALPKTTVKPAANADMRNGNNLYQGKCGACFEGSEATLDEVQRRLGGEVIPGSRAFWNGLREQSHPFFAGDAPLWRCTVPPLSSRLSLAGTPLIEWNGQQRWYRCPPGVTAFEAAAAVGGHATLFHHAAGNVDVFSPLPPVMLRLHRALKREFDPAGILNPGPMYADL